MVILASEAPRIAINIERLLQVYDARTPDITGHISALSAMVGEDLGAGLIAHYLQSRGYEVSIITKCTPGSRDGSRLDRWIAAVKPRKRLLYQVEIKNWLAKTYGGGPTLPLDAKPLELQTYRRARWATISHNGRLDDKVKKVLEPMNPPDGFSNFHHHALLCLWWSLHSKGKANFWFKEKMRGGEFNPLYVMSMSAYLRHLRRVGEIEIEIPAPIFHERMARLADLYRAEEWQFLDRPLKTETGSCSG